MAKKNPDHFRATFEFHEDIVWVSCSCGLTMQGDDTLDAFRKLGVHHANVARNEQSTKNIYKEAN